MSFNPMQLIGMIKNGGNPQQIIQQMMGNNQIMQNPMARSTIEMLQKGDSEGLQKMAENLCKENGTTVDEIKNQLAQQFGIK